MSSIFLSFGPKSGFLLSNTLNNLIECNDMPPTWYSENSNKFLPNCIFFDNAKSVKLYEDYDFEEQYKEISKQRKVSNIDLPKDGSITIPKFKPTPFVEYIKNGGSTILPLDKPRPNFYLENYDISWCDIINFNLSRKSFVEIPGTDIEPLNTYMKGFEKASENDSYYEFTDPIRKIMETCDRVTTFFNFVDRNNGYGGFFAKTSEYLMEEAPKAVRITYSIAEQIDSDEIASNASLSLASSLEVSNIHSVLLLPQELPPIFDINKIKLNNDYINSFILSMSLTSSILPILNNVTTSRQYLDILSPSSILKFVSLSSSFPSFDPITSFGFPTNNRIFSKLVLVSGIGKDQREHIYETNKPDSPYFYSGFGNDMPLFIGLTAPHIFKDNYITIDGQKPTEKPPNLSQEDYDKLVKFGVIKRKEGVNNDLIKVLSTISEYSTSSSLSIPLSNSIDFIKNSCRITRDISQGDCDQLAEFVHNIIDGLTDDFEQ